VQANSLKVSTLLQNSRWFCLGECCHPHEWITKRGRSARSLQEDPFSAGVSQFGGFCVNYTCKFSELTAGLDTLTYHGKWMIRTR